MEEVLIEGIRCFHEAQAIPLRPLTLLVGENSTGKSTVLAMVRIAWALCQADPVMDFNEEPFHLGTHDQLVSYRGGRAGRAKSFSIAVRLRLRPRQPDKSHEPIPEDAVISGSFGARDGQPFLTRWQLKTGDNSVDIEYGPGLDQRTVTVLTPSGMAKLAEPRVAPSSLRMPQLFRYLRFVLTERVQDEDAPKVEGRIKREHLSFLDEVAFEWSRVLGPRPYAFAPIRTHPQRTYDAMSNVPRPEGSHIPMLLARTFTSDPEGWAKLRTILDQFGKASGLYDDLVVRRLGRKESDPFQIRVRISGPPFNLVDVGYGVSQGLPIVVDALREPRGTTFLLQQPEVHLHPRAQAELATFLAFLAKTQHKRFVIETHSDHLLDRVRIDLREKKYLTPKDVAILFFQRTDTGVTIHRLDLDDMANIVNPPPGYRDFFLDEERRFLGLE